MDWDSDTWPGWCEWQATSMVQTVDADESFEVTHTCVWLNNHEGPHTCRGCGTRWEGQEVPC